MKAHPADGDASEYWMKYADKDVQERDNNATFDLRNAIVKNLESKIDYDRDDDDVSSSVNQILRDLTIDFVYSYMYDKVEDDNVSHSYQDTYDALFGDYESLEHHGIKGQR